MLSSFQIIWINAYIRWEDRALHCTYIQIKGMTKWTNLEAICCSFFVIHVKMCSMNIILLFWKFFTECLLPFAQYQTVFESGYTHPVTHLQSKGKMIRNKQQRSNEKKLWQVGCYGLVSTFVSSNQTYTPTALTIIPVKEQNKLNRVSTFLYIRMTGKSSINTEKGLDWMAY